MYMYLIRIRTYMYMYMYCVLSKVIPIQVTVEAKLRWCVGLKISVYFSVLKTRK